MAAKEVIFGDAARAKMVEGSPAAGLKKVA